MNHEAFEETKKQILASGVSVADARYLPATFGSWHIAIQTDPRSRIVWDGKDKWLVVEEETTEMFNGLRVWKERWLVRNPNVEDMKTGIRKLPERAKLK